MRPAGDKQATTSEDVATTLLSERIKELERQKYDQAMGGLRRIASLEQMANEWLDYLGKTETRAKTVERYKLAFTHLYKVLERTKRIDQITVSEARHALVALRAVPSRFGRGLSNSSIHHVLAAVRQAHDYAADEGAARMSGNPWRLLRKIDRPKRNATSADFLEVYEAAALLTAIATTRTRFVPLRAIVATMLLTGGRRSEVFGLEVGDIDFDRDTVTIRPNRWRPLKRGGPRTVPLFPQLRAELRAYIAESGRIGGLLLFPGRGTGGGEQLLAGGKLYDQLRRAAKVAGIESKRVTPQALRVTYCAARLQSLDGGRPCAHYTVQTEMGHASMDMITRVYGRLGTVRHREEGVEYVPSTAAAVRADVTPQEAGRAG
jgi:integrase